MIAYLTAGIIFLLAGFIQGVTGFGSALVAIPLLTLMMDIKTAVPLCILNSLIITTYLSLKMRRHMDFKKLSPLCLAAIPGVIVGVTILKAVPSDIIRLTLGVLLIAYSAYSLISRPKSRHLPIIWAYIAGFSTGAIGAAFSAGGPPTIIYTTLTNWDKNEIKATLSGFFLFNSYLVAAIHAYTGITTGNVLVFFAWTAPLVFAGTLTGSICYGRFHHETYIKIIFTMLILMGIIMICS